MNRLALAAAAGMLSIFPGTASAVPQDGPDRVTTIACVGDSITEGNANADHTRNSYPAILERLLQKRSPGRYRVHNFGRSGATLLRNGHRPYRDQEVHRAALESAPDVVLINLGTNDATRRNFPEHGDRFEQDLRDLIDAFRSLDTSPKILLSNLTPLFPPYPHVEENEPWRQEVEAVIRRVAGELELRIVDFKTPLTDAVRLFPDGLHPNTAGNEVMARQLFRTVTGAESPRDDSIRPGPVAGEPRVLVESGRAREVVVGGWSGGQQALNGTGPGNRILSAWSLREGDFHLRARLRMEKQRNSAAGFFLDRAFLGFEGARGTLFRNLPGLGLRLLHPSPALFERGDWIDFQVIRNGAQVWFLIDDFIVDMALLPGPIEEIGFDPYRSSMQIESWSLTGSTAEYRQEQLKRRTKNCPWIDLSIGQDRLSLSDRPLEDASDPIWPCVLDPGPDGSILEILAGRSAHGNSLARRPGGAEHELPASLSGERHVALRLADGRWLVAFRDRFPGSPTRDDWVAWVGSHQDLLAGREGDFTCRLIPGALCGTLPGYPSLHGERDGTLVFGLDAVPAGGSMTVHFSLAEMEALVPTRGYDLPLIDLDQEIDRQVVVDREAEQYLGHPTTCLLEDGKTILCVYPKGHGRGAVIYRRSGDGGRTWSERLQTPASWATSKEVPTLHRVIDPTTGQKRIIMWSGLYPARLAVSEDDGNSWGELEKVGDWGGIVVMGFVERLKDGRYLAMFHDDGRFFSADNSRRDPAVFNLYQTISADGGLTWSQPESIWQGSDVHLCEPGCIRSPDGETLAVLLRENSRRRNSYALFSRDEGETWSAPRELPAALTGDRHTGRYGPDGRLFISFRDTTHDSPTKGDWVGWVGSFDDILYGRPGQYRVRLKDNTHRADTAYPGVEVLPDGTFVTTTYGHWDRGEPPYILSVRFSLEDLDRRAAGMPVKQDLLLPGMNGVHTYRIPALVTSNAGTLLAACDARLDSSSDLPNDIHTVLRRSTDGGRSWDEIRTVLDHPDGEGAADPCLLVDRQTGAIWLAVTWSRDVGWRDSKPGFGQDSFRNLLLVSDDDGVSWSRPRDVTRDLKDPSWRSSWFSPGAGLQTRSGRLLLPYSAADAEGSMFSYAAISDDHGRSWTRVGPMGERTNEHMIAQLADDTLLCNMRSTHGRGLRAISRSIDDGDHWTELVHDEALIEPVCKGSLLTIPGRITPDGRDWLLFANPASNKRDNLTVRISRDGGRSWQDSRTIHAGPTAYSSMALTPDGQLGLLYECGDRHPYQAIRFARIPLPWLVAAPN